MLSIEFGQPLEQLLNSIPMKVELPPALEQALEVERGVVDSTPFEARRTVRFRCRGNAVVFLLESPFEVEGQEATAAVIVRNVSRTGLGLIAHQQYYPEQRVMLVLENSTMEGRIARARKIGPACFEIGAFNVGKKA